MNRARQFRSQDSMNLTLTGHPADACKGLAFQQDIEMALAPFPVSGMAVVPVTVVDHFKALWRESLGQLLMDHSCDWAGFDHVQFWKWKA
jgi:hypothetical protein